MLPRAHLLTARRRSTDPVAACAMTLCAGGAAANQAAAVPHFPVPSRRGLAAARRPSKRHRWRICRRRLIRLSTDPGGAEPPDSPRVLRSVRHERRGRTHLLLIAAERL